MQRDYVIRPRCAPVHELIPDLDAENYLARTVYEEHELIDIGLLDSEGNKILARKRMDPVGFIRWPERS
jgi:hypothetical protein